MSDARRDVVECGADHENKLTREEFGRLFISRLRELGVTSEVTFHPEDFSVTSTQGDGDTQGFHGVFLSNTYRDYLNAPPNERDEILSKLVRVSLLSEKILPGDFEEAARNLLPAIRCRSRHEVNCLRNVLAGGGYSETSFTPFGIHLAMTVTYNLPDAVFHLNEDALGQWNVTPQQAMHAALKQLAALSHPFKTVEGHRGIFESAADDGYDASRMLLPPLVEVLPVRGARIVMVPHPSHLYVAGEDDPVALEIMVRHAEWVLNQSRPISGYAFRLHDGEWRPWLPDSSHSLYQQFRKLQLQTASNAYSSQGNLLHALEERKAEAEQCFVATFMVGSRKADDPLRAMTAWTEGVATLLPKVDEICFIRGSVRTGHEMIGPVPWARVVEILGDRMEPQGLYPERYRVRTFPTDAELTALTAV